jgi:hypothetical protein
MDCLAALKAIILKRVHKNENRAELIVASQLIEDHSSRLVRSHIGRMLEVESAVQVELAFDRLAGIPEPVKQEADRFLNDLLRLAVGGKANPVSVIPDRAYPGIRIGVFRQNNAKYA